MRTTCARDVDILCTFRAPRLDFMTGPLVFDSTLALWEVDCAAIRVLENLRDGPGTHR